MWTPLLQHLVLDSLHRPLCHRGLYSQRSQVLSPAWRAHTQRADDSPSTLRRSPPLPRMMTLLNLCLFSVQMHLFHQNRVQPLLSPATPQFARSWNRLPERPPWEV